MTKIPINRPLNFTGAAPKFWHFSQNNSGGSFVQDNTAGISHHVIIEAEDVAQAIELAERIGLYFDGCSQGIDCDCCGDRWSTPYGNPNDVPMIYDIDVSSGLYQSPYGAWMKDGIEGYIHYLDGRVVAVKAAK